LSSDHEPHWVIRKTAEGDGTPRDARIDPEHFRAHQSAKLILHTPRERVLYLEQLDEAIGSDDSTLRSRAELLQLRSEMRKTHEKLLQLKR
jgi:hypothetical protein